MLSVCLFVADIIADCLLLFDTKGNRISTD